MDLFLDRAVAIDSTSRGRQEEAGYPSSGHSGSYTGGGKNPEARGVVSSAPIEFEF
ncbi:MAG: hypothetical protein JRF33_03705 [Deltaproteobacteria bacterium]|nr:hypothetical protein [Deltaproteobacteria bacterium]